MYMDQRLRQARERERMRARVPAELREQIEQAGFEITWTFRGDVKVVPTNGDAVGYTHMDVLSEATGHKAIDVSTGCESCGHGQHLRLVGILDEH